MSMFMLATPSEDGTTLQFFPGESEFLAGLAEYQQGTEVPALRALTPAEAARDSNYWPEGAVFAAEIRSLDLEPVQVATGYRLRP